MRQRRCQCQSNSSQSPLKRSRLRPNCQLIRPQQNQQHRFQSPQTNPEKLGKSQSNRRRLANSQSNKARRTKQDRNHRPPITKLKHPTAIRDLHQIQDHRKTKSKRIHLCYHRHQLVIVRPCQVCRHWMILTSRPHTANQAAEAKLSPTTMVICVQSSVSSCHTTDSYVSWAAATATSKSSRK